MCVSLSSSSSSSRPHFGARLLFLAHFLQVCDNNSWCSLFRKHSYTLACFRTPRCVGNTERSCLISPNQPEPECVMDRRCANQVFVLMLGRHNKATVKPADGLRRMIDGYLQQTTKKLLMKIVMLIKKKRMWCNMCKLTSNADSKLLPNLAA